MALNHPGSAFSDFMDSEDLQRNYVTFQYDGTSIGYHILNGVSRIGDSFIVECDEEGEVVADLEKKVVLRAHDHSASGVIHHEIVDLSVDGDRWEGDVLSDAPCGWGIVYDKEGRKDYEGFRVGEWNVCYGVKYYADIGRVEYAGEWCEGKRWGRGIQYDREGAVVYDGEWLNDEHLNRRVVMTLGNELLHNHIEELIVSDSCCNGEEWNVMDLKLMPSLKSLNVGDDCFSRVNELRIVGLRELESVVIGVNCFTHNEYEPVPNRHFSVKKCPKLRELRMGTKSFSDYTVCEIESVDALEVIEMGDLTKWSADFYNASLELRSFLLHSE